MSNFFMTLEFKIWSYLWRTIDGSHPEPHKTRLRNIKISPFSLLSSEKSKLRKRVFRQRKRWKWPIFSWRWNSKFWDYLWRTSDGSNPEPHKTRLRNIKISPFSLLSSENLMLGNRVFSQRKIKNDQFSWRWNSNLWGNLWRTRDVTHPEPHK
jgi:hypothetical protein